MNGYYDSDVFRMSTDNWILALLYADSIVFSKFFYKLLKYLSLILELFSVYINFAVVIGVHGAAMRWLACCKDLGGGGCWRCREIFWLVCQNTVWWLLVSFGERLA